MNFSASNDSGKLLFIEKTFNTFRSLRAVLILFVYFNEKSLMLYSKRSTTGRKRFAIL